MSAQAPMLVSWNLTRACNLACSHCYLDALQRGGKSSGELGTAEVCEVIQQIADLAPGAMLVLSGGEPLLRRDLDALVQHAATRGLAPVIGTNGTMVDELRAHRLKAAGAAGVGVSLDSAAPLFHDRLRGVPGAWEGARRGMQAAREAGLAILVQTTLFEENRHELAAIADIAESDGAMALNFFFLVCVGRGVTQTDLTPAQYEETLARIVQLQRERPRLMIRARCAPYLRRILGFSRNARLLLARTPLNGLSVSIWRLLFYLYLLAAGHDTLFVAQLASINWIFHGLTVIPAGILSDLFG
ncbi:MAG: radical SAM protein, partial [Betaproteobacteria bacterium]|nr:radical SAM protein [Betaproteobacteria bacterium]